MKIRKGDTVKLITGKDRSKTGKVLEFRPSESRLVVEGVNMSTKHLRSKKEGQKGQRIQFPAPLQISNVMLVCPKCGKATRVGLVGQGKSKLRQCKRCRETFE